MKFIVILFAIFSTSLAYAGGYTYDPNTGNSYYTTNNYDGSTRVNGSNAYTGSTWNTTIQPSGNMSGMDSNYNTWTYNSSTGSYTNSDGHGCIGKGYARSCW